MALSFQGQKEAKLQNWNLLLEQSYLSSYVLANLTYHNGILLKGNGCAMVCKPIVQMASFPPSYQNLCSSDMTWNNLSDPKFNWSHGWGIVSMLGSTLLGSIDISEYRLRRWDFCVGQVTFVQFWGSPFKRDIVKWGHIEIRVRKHEDCVVGGMTEDLSTWNLTRGQDRLAGPRIWRLTDKDNLVYTSLWCSNLSSTYLCQVIN